jgi:DNA-binding NarL/FixJ family response regulator
MNKQTPSLSNQNQNETKFRILTIQSDELVQLAIAQILTDNSDFEIIGQANEIYQGIKQTISLKPDLVILDLKFSDVDDLTIIQKLKVSFPQVKILVFTYNQDQNIILAAIANGVNAYCLNNIPLSQLLAAITTAAHGGIYLDSQITPLVVDKLKLIKPKVNPEKLSDRESEILKLIVQGKTNNEIGAELYLSPNTVKTHIRSMMNKLLVDDRVQIAVEALRSGLL